MQNDLGLCSTLTKLRHVSGLQTLITISLKTTVQGLIDTATGMTCNNMQLDRMQTQKSALKTRESANSEITTLILAADMDSVSSIIWYPESILANQ